MMLITPTAPVWIAARALLAERKDDLEQRWKRALKSFDAEDIHDLRVSSRRLREALALFSPCFPAKSLSRVSSRVKRLTQLLGTMRNTDEALLFFSDLAAPQLPAGSPLAALIKQLEAEREKERKALAEGFKSLPLRPLREQLDSVFKRPAVFCNDRIDPFMAMVDFARREISERDLPVRELLPLACREEDISSQHRLRIATKRLRYRYEILAPLVREGHGELLATVKAYQEVLGKMHDLDVFAEMVAKRLSDVTTAALLLEEISNRRHALFAAFIGMLDTDPLDTVGERMRGVL